MTEIPDLWREVAKTQDVDKFVKSNDKIDETAIAIQTALEGAAQTQAAGQMPPGGNGKALAAQTGGMAG